jgi:cysteine synthase
MSLRLHDHHRFLSRMTIFLSIAAPIGLLFIYHRTIMDTMFPSQMISDGGDEEPLCTTCGFLELIGNTPIIELKKLSHILGRRIFVKMESMNPSGTGKDRASKRMIVECMKSIDKQASHRLDIVEGTSGSTGIALANICNALGHNLHVVLPDDQAEEKKRLLETLGASVYIVPVCSISNDNHYVNEARRLANRIGGIFVNQFENIANYQVHYEETGPEIWKQMHGKIGAFVMSAGTGGTIAGISKYLKSRDPSVKIVLADPHGSSLHQAVKYGVCYTSQQRERSIKKHRYDSIVEGVGLDRLTNNFQLAEIDDSEQVDDQEIIDMAHWLQREEGLFVGSSSALNIVAACRTAKTLPAGSQIVTMVCDNGQRHLSRFWNPAYVSNYGINWPAYGVIPSCLR